MPRSNNILSIVETSKKAVSSVTKESSLLHQEELINSYFQSYRIRNYSPKTINKEKRFLEGWFETHSLFTWEAMVPISGRKRIQDYGSTLLATEISVNTIRSYLGVLRRYFSYILEFPFVTTDKGPRRLQNIYGPIDQPVTEYDIPHHVYDGERLGVPLDPEKLYDFYALLRESYLNHPQWAATRARNYTYAILAGESGLRSDELLHLEISKDLFFKSNKLQTRHAKGTKGSGKRSRLTLFSPLARDTVQFYLSYHRPSLNPQTDHLFVSQSGLPMTYSCTNKALQEMIQVAKKEHFPISDHLGWHWFRRIFATRFIERFPNKLPVLIDLLGHVTPNTVHRYVRHSEAWMDKEIQSVLEGALQWPSIGD